TRNSSLNTDNILRFLQVRQEGASADDILRGLDLPRNERKSLFKMLSKWKKRNLIVEVAQGKYRLKSKKETPSEGLKREQGQQRKPTSGVSGRLVLHQDGYGFVISDEPIPNIEGDVFIPRHATEDAMHGDHVVVEISRRGLSSEGQRIEGRIVRVLDRAQPTVVGLFPYGPHG